MDRVNRILRNQKYQEYLSSNAAAEANRIFCHHDLTHAIDVSRVAYILALEEGLDLNKDIIYATGLLHDIGRWLEYSQGMDHAKTSAALAPEILADSGYGPVAMEHICLAIEDHRICSHPELDLNRILYKSDKLSRPCTSCLALDQCKRFADGGAPMLTY